MNFLLVAMALGAKITTKSKLNGLLVSTEYKQEQTQMLQKLAITSNPGKQDLINQRKPEETAERRLTRFDKSNPTGSAGFRAKSISMVLVLLVLI